MGDDSGMSPRTAVPRERLGRDEVADARVRVPPVERVEVDEIEVQLPPELDVHPPPHARPPTYAHSTSTSFC